MHERDSDFQIEEVKGKLEGGNEGGSGGEFLREECKRGERERRKDGDETWQSRESTRMREGECDSWRV